MCRDWKLFAKDDIKDFKFFEVFVCVEAETVSLERAGSIWSIIFKVRTTLIVLLDRTIDTLISKSQQPS